MLVRNVMIRNAHDFCQGIDYRCHCEERSDTAISSPMVAYVQEKIATGLKALAMTWWGGQFDKLEFVKEKMMHSNLFLQLLSQYAAYKRGYNHKSKTHYIGRKHTVTPIC